jgi:peptidoglycan-associated lipoprotein
MQIKKIINILILALSVITIFSCSHDNIKSNNVRNTNIMDTNLKRNKHDLIRASHVQEILQTLYKNNVIYFDFNKFQINSIFLKSLDNIADFLCNHRKNTICIEGHTDDSGANKYNFLLSEKRIQEVRSYFIKKGVLDEQISFVSYGKEKPIIDCNLESCYANNRRAVIIIH